MASSDTTDSSDSALQPSTSGIVPCLWFDDRAEEAADFYASTFPVASVTGVSRYPEDQQNPAGKPPGSVLAVEFDIAGRRFCALNGGPQYQITPSISFFVEFDDAAEAERLFVELAESGEVMMPFDAYPWSEKYGWVEDQFGTSWQVITVDEVADAGPVYPCLLFSDAQRGRGAEAINFYVDVFPNSSVERIEHYDADEGPDDYVKHGRFMLDGQLMVITDSHIEHGFEFSEGVSLQILCDDQDSVDYYWERLTADGEESQGGWLEDRFGVSWQVVPA
jgi:predicted 3-demethylubiquinone-9 3-methyltransferase (glyoxalase superfamily)